MESVTLSYMSPKFDKNQMKKKLTLSQNYNKNFKGRSWGLYTVSQFVETKTITITGHL